MVEFEFGSIHNHTYLGVATSSLRDGYDCWKDKNSVCLSFMTPCALSLNGKQYELGCQVFADNRLRVKVDMENSTIEWERIFPNVETLA